MLSRARLAVTAITLKRDSAYAIQFSEARHVSMAIARGTRWTRGERVPVIT
jgi:hypothetical protein